MASATAAPKRTTGEQAINLALAAGFEVTNHARANGCYRHQLTHADGRALTIDTALGTGRLVLAEGRNRTYWNATYLAARNLKALRALLDVGGKTSAQIPAQLPTRRTELSEQHQWALENERRLRNDLRRERRHIYGR